MKSIVTPVMVCIMALITVSASAASLPVTQGLIAYYSFDDGTATDDSGNNNHGNAVSDPAATPGVIGNAIDLDGNDYFAVASTPQMRPNYMTVSVWLKTTDIDGKRHVIFGSMYRNSSGANGFDITYRESGSINDDLMTRGSGNHGGGPGFVGDGQWNHVVISWDGRYHRSYHNGVLVHTWDVNDFSQYFSGPIYWNAPHASNFHIGGYNQLPERNGQYEPFKGQLDELAYFNRALSDTEVSQLFEATQAIPTPSALLASLAVMACIGIKRRCI